MKRPFLPVAAVLSFLIPASHAAAEGPVIVMLELNDEPAVETHLRALASAKATTTLSPQAQAARTVRAHLVHLDAVQEALSARLAGPDLGARPLFRLQRAYAGIAVEVDEGRFARLASLPGVKAVHRMTPFRPELATSVPLAGAPTAWMAASNLTGEGFRIGIIDTGIDYRHADFGGSGFPGPKVAGGVDLAGDAYDADSTDPAKRIPHPDADPMDCNGHGTHVAGIAAGYGVKADGTRYAGSYGPETPFDSLRIGPGVAPGAKLYAIKVFGCSGSSYLTAAGIEWAVDPNGDGDFSDHLDVLNISIGAAYIAPDDPAEVAADNASRLGVLVARSAGNDGDATFISGARSSLAVVTAASLNLGWVVDAIRVVSPASLAGPKSATFSAAFAWDQMTAPVTAALAYPTSQPTGCAPFDSTSSALLAGKIALLDYPSGGCGSATRVGAAKSAGAVGAVFAYASTPLDTILSGTSQIPAVLVDRATGDALRSASPSGVTVTLSKDLRNASRVDNPANVDSLSSFSSLGPSSTGILKPDVTAPGQVIFSAAAQTGSQGVSNSGTSMASPHVAGALALLRQLHPTWSVSEIKAALLGTAGHDLFTQPGQTPPSYSPSRVGTGRIDLAAASAATVLAYDADNPGLVHLSFGLLEVVGSLTATRTLRISNKGVGSVTVDVAYRPFADVPGVSITFPAGTTATVLAGGTVDLPVRLSAVASQMRHSRDPAMPATQQGAPRLWLSEEQGLVLVTPRGGSPQRVGLYAAARPASRMASAVKAIPVAAATGTADLGLAGTGVDTGSSYPTDITSAVTPLELVYLSVEPPADLSVRGSAALKAIGVRTDVKTMLAQGKTVADATLAIGLASFVPWGSPVELGVTIPIDTNGDGVSDFSLSTAQYVNNGQPLDSFIGTLCPLPSGTCTVTGPLNNQLPESFDTALFGSDVLWIPVKASALGLSASKSKISFRLQTSRVQSSYAVPSLTTYGPFTFDAGRPGLDVTGGDFGSGVYRDLPTTTIHASWDREAALANGSKGVLLLHHHDVSSTRADVVPFTGSADLAVVQGVDPDPAQTGRSLAVTATVSNAGPWSASAVTLSFAVPAGATFVSASPSRGTCAGTTAISCALGPMTGGATATVRIVLTPTTSGSLVTRFDVSAPEPDPDPSSNSSTKTTAVLATATARRTVPILLDVVGQGGARFSSELFLANSSATDATLTLAYTGATPLGGAGTGSATVSLPAGRQLVVADALAYLRGLGLAIPLDPPQGGTLGVAFAGLSSPGAAFAGARTTAPSGNGRAGLAYPGLAPDSVATSVLLYGLRQNATDRSNLALVNAGTSAVTLRVTLFSGSGDRTTTVLPDVPLAAGQWLQLSGVLSTASYANGYARVDRVAGTAPFQAYAVFNDNATSDGSFVPAVLPDRTAGWQLLPVLVETGLYDSELVLTNPLETPVLVTLRYQETLAAPTGFTGTVTDSLAPHEQRIVPHALDYLRSLGARIGPKGGSYAGPLFVLFRSRDLPADGFAGARTSSPAPGGGQYGVFYPALLASEGAASEAWVYGLKQDATSRSNLAVGNMSQDGAPITVVVDIFDSATGQLAATTDPISLGPGARQQLNAFLGSYGLASGYVRIRKTSGTSSFFAYGVVNDGATSDTGTNDGSYVGMTGGD